MPASETICVTFGNWIAAFPVVYAMAGIAVVAASAILIDWRVGKVRASRLSTNTRRSPGIKVADSRA